MMDNLHVSELAPRQAAMVDSRLSHGGAVASYGYVDYALSGHRR
jgi:hypothetical protein